MIINHGLGSDGTKASPEEIERARAWNRAGRDFAAKPAAAVAASTSAFTQSSKAPEFVFPDYDYSSDIETPKV